MATSKDQKAPEPLSQPPTDDPTSPPTLSYTAPTDPPPYNAPKPRTSTRNKVLDLLKKPFASLTASSEHGGKKEAAQDRSPALQAGIERMEARKAVTIRKMEEEGKDTSVLSGRRADQVRNPLRG